MRSVRCLIRIVAVVAFGGMASGCATTAIEGASCVSGDCMDGAGRLELAGGGTYEGAFSSGLYWGIGVLTVGQVSYEGQWSNGRPDGSGTLNGADFVYSGRFDDGEFSGSGELVLESGVAFRGGFDDGVPEEGRLVLADGGVFGGEIASDNGDLILDGQLQKPDGTVSIGSFRLTARAVRIPALEDPVGRKPDGEPLAFGRHRLQHPDGTREEVSFENGQRQGRGRMELPNGRTVILAWEQGKTVYRAPGPETVAAQRQARACRLTSEDWVYFGEACRNGLAHGKGLAYSKDGEKTFRGRFEDGGFAQGELITMGGDIRSGSWKNFELHGKGRAFEEGQLVYRGHFRDGQRHGKGLCVEGDKGARCEYYEGKRVDQAHKMRQLSQSDLASAGDGRAAGQAAMEALRESSEERAEQWSDRIGKHARKRQSLQGPGLLSQALRVGADIYGRMEDGGGGYADGGFAGSGSSDAGGSSLSSQLLGSSGSSGGGEGGIAEYIMQTGVEVSRELQASQARTNRLIKQANQRQRQINRKRRQQYQRQQELRRQRQKQRQERIRREYAAVQAKIAQRHQRAGQQRQRNEQEDNERRNVPAQSTSFTMNILPAATYDPDTGYSSPGEPETITVGGGSRRAGTGRTETTGSTGRDSSVGSAANGNDDTEYVQVREGLSVCWESSPGNGHWWCAGPTQELLSSWDTESEAREMSGCDSPRRVVEGVQVSRDGRGAKWARGVSANLYYCNFPLAEYNDDIREEFDFRIPPSVPAKTYECEADGDGGWSTGPRYCK